MPETVPPLIWLDHWIQPGRPFREQLTRCLLPRQPYMSPSPLTPQVFSERFQVSAMTATDTTEPHLCADLSRERMPIAPRDQARRRPVQWSLPCNARVLQVLYAKVKSPFHLSRSAQNREGGRKQMKGIRKTFPESPVKS